MAPTDKDFVLETVKEQDVHFIRLWFTDVLGFLKSFAITDAELEPVLRDWCEAFGRDCDEVLSVPFTKLVPVSHRPYGKLYANM
jgi:glutamine synthetase